MEFPMFDIVQQTLPPDTSTYMIAGYAVIFGSMLLYVLSLVIRRKNLEQDLVLLEEMREKENILEKKAESQVLPEDRGSSASPVKNI
jgi:hypothetical protein